MPRRCHAALPPSRGWGEWHEKLFLGPFFLLLFLFSSAATAQLLFECNNSADCDQKVGWDSQCLEDGMCSNPFAQGCLHKMKRGGAPVRVCNSEDNDPLQNHCRPPQIPYTELRLRAQDWESTVFESWIIQIVLSELLGVPTTIETGVHTSSHMNFYSPKPTFTLGDSDVEGSLKRAYELAGNCPLASRDEENYEPCAHVSLENWETNLGWVQEYVGWVQEFIHNGTIEQPTPSGVLGMESWFVTKFTAENDTSLTSYLGMQGDDNRQKLADTFLRPTTWMDYCQDVSNNNCSTPDAVAQRAPQTSEEIHRMFVDGIYTGHFRKTAENDCETYPHNCTGHVADYPCGWSSHVEAQTHYLNIPMASSGKEPGSRGYTYSQLVEQWRAANATKSNLMMFWWTSDPVYQEFVGTEAEFQRVLFPTPTQECVKARLTPLDRCSRNSEERIGNPAGACDEIPNPLEKLISTGLHTAIYESSIPQVVQSPAIDVVNAFRVSELQFGEIFEYMRTKRTPREAICQWAVENLETLKTFIPRDYPRVVREDVQADPGVGYASIILGSIATSMVLLTCCMVYHRRDQRAIRYAQIEFLWVLLAGHFCVAVGSVVIGFTPSNASCIAAVWLVNLGYSVELIPLIVKVAAINQLHSAATRMKRVVITRQSLFQKVFFINGIVVVFLIVWTILDPPSKTAEYELTDASTADDETIVSVNFYCSSENDAWRFVAVGWICLLLLCGSVLAFQSRKAQKHFNESQTLALMMYSRLMFVVLWVITFFLSGNISDAFLERLRGIIFGVDTMMTLIIYFVPKFWMRTLLENRSSVAWGMGDLQEPVPRPFASKLSSVRGGPQVTLDPCSECGRNCWCERVEMESLVENEEQIVETDGKVTTGATRREPALDSRPEWCDSAPESGRARTQ